MADTWPPEPFDIAFARFRELDAWWTGDTATLAEIYSGRDGATHTVNGQLYRGGVRGTLSKWWHGQPIVQGESRMKSHLPVAADLCTLSADLLFGEAPQVVFRKPDNVEPKKDATGKPIKWRHPAQDRLDAILGTDDSHAELLLGGELAAAHGAVYISVAWDPQISDHVFPKVYAADCAIPVFRHGRLAGVRLWSEYRDGNEVYRLIESHEPGWVEYALYRGGDKTLGDLVPIASRPETAHYERLRNESDMAVALANPGALPLSVRIGTGSTRLAVTYMKNAVPVRDWRKLGPLAHLGRSDLDGIQDELDKIDMAWSSLWRDIENGQGRLIVAEEALDLTGSPGEGAKFDPYRQVFTAIGATLGKAADGGRLVDEVQFDIRVTEHLEAIEAALKRIGSTLGYSEPHLGIDASRGGQTATEITADLSDSERTRDKKAIFARSAIAQWARVALEIDHAVHGGDALGDLDVLPDVVFAPISQADPEKLTRIAALMEGIASLKERVRVQHPDWDDDEVAAEVEEIKAEQKALRDATPDPASFDGDDPDAEKHDEAEASDEK